MAKGGRRTYARDNRGRFASTGATARGGRLKTAAGNKRKTVTTRMEGGKAAGTIGKARKAGAGVKTGAKLASASVSKARPALRPGSKEFPIKNYVEAVRATRQSAKNPSRHTSKQEAQQEYKLAKKSLSLRIMRERGSRQGLKKLSFWEAVTGKQ